MEKWDPWPAWVGVGIGAAIMEDGMQASQKTTIWSSKPTAGYRPRELMPASGRDMSTPTITTALLITAKIQNQPECPPTSEWIKKM